MNLRLTGNKSSRVRTTGYMHRYVSVFVLCVIAGSVFPMGSGTGGGGTASGGGSGTSQIEEGDRAMRLYDQGIRAMNSKKFTEAQVRFEQALIENPSFAEAHNYLGYLLQMEGPQNYPIALEQYDRAIRLKPDLAEAYEYRAVLLLRINRKTAAEKDLRTLEALRPKLATELERIIKSGKAETGDVVKHSGQIR